MKSGRIDLIISHDVMSGQNREGKDPWNLDLL